MTFLYILAITAAAMLPVLIWSEMQLRKPEKQD